VVVLEEWNQLLLIITVQYLQHHNLENNFDVIASKEVGTIACILTQVLVTIFGFGLGVQLVAMAVKVVHTVDQVVLPMHDSS
tara:strand:- start:856 stop:1101 length:246 start_codon:yes stop_codon:yes gene_type:complete